MRFCRECNNLLHARENKDLRRLEFACKLCPYIDRNVQGVSAIWVNEIVKDSS
jgi:DNA-directed RNA polymerase subunit M/transcription elongation factor TFIIS